MAIYMHTCAVCVLAIISSFLSIIVSCVCIVVNRGCDAMIYSSMSYRTHHMLYIRSDYSQGIYFH